MTSDISIPLSREEIDKIDLGALLSRDVIEENPEYGTRIIELEFERGTIHRTEFYASEELLEQNSALRRDSEGHRWGDGQLVARIPMNVWAKEIAPRQRDGNTKSLRKWLNDAANRHVRTFKGTV